MSFIDKGFLMDANLDTREVKNVEGRSISFYNTDKNISSLYMKLKIAQKGEPQRELQKNEVAGYKINITAIKPKTNQYRIVEGILSDDLVDESCAIWKFGLDEEFTNQIGPVTCWAKIIDGDKVLNMNSFAYDVNADGLTGLNEEIVTDKDLPILEELIEKVQKTNNINDIKVSETETYSNKKIEDKFNTIEQKKADKTEVDIERKRLDNIIANSNSTEGNSELVDVRVGADGTVYDCAGKAVREQFSNNNSKIQQNTSKNTEQDSRLINIEQKNKVQDVYLNGLFNENNDGRLSINGEGNDLKLEGSKGGLVTVDSVVGNTLVNCFKGFNVYKGLVAVTPGIITVTNRTINLKGTGGYPGIIYKDFLLKPNTIYTLIVSVDELNIKNQNSAWCILRIGEGDGKTNISVPNPSNTGLYVKSFTTPAVANILDMQTFLRQELDSTCNVKMSDMVILEGDYTNKPIPTQAFEGIQSSFEGNLVTQEMVDAGTELASNLGKYKVPMKVVGKNKLSSKVFDNIINASANGIYNKELGTLNVKNTTNSSWSHCYIENQVKPNTRYIIRAKSTNGTGLQEIAIRKLDDSQIPLISNSISDDPNIYRVFNSGNSNVVRFKFYCTRSASQIGDVIYADIQLEEVEELILQPTPYEPYFESKHNIYLNSPLLKGDTLECRNDGVYHVHNMGKVVLDGSRNWNVNSVSGTVNNLRFSCIINNIKPYSALMTDRFINQSGYTNDVEGIFMGGVNGLDFSLYIFKSKLETQDVAGIKKWLQANPTTVIYELAEPWEEKVSDNKFLCEIANGSTLYLDSNTPVANVKATYTSNVVSVVKLDKIQYQQDQINLDNVYRLTMLETTMGI